MDDLGSLLLETWIESALAIQEPAFGPPGVEKQLGTDARLFSSLGSHSSGFVSKFDSSVVLHSGRKMLKKLAIKSKRNPTSEALNQTSISIVFNFFEC